MGDPSLWFVMELSFFCYLQNCPMIRVIIISTFLGLRSLVHTSNFTLPEILAWPAAARHHALRTLHARTVQAARCMHALCTLHERIVHAARTHCARCALLHAAFLSFSGDEWQSGPSHGSINGFQPKVYGYEQAKKGAGPSTI